MKGDLISVKDYAAKQGMTEQAAYKQIKAGKLQTVEIQENGKPKKYIFCPDPPEATTEQGTPKVITAETDPASKALSMAIDALTAQLEAKDKQIIKLTELLNQSQQLQAHGQKLLEQTAQEPQPEAQEADTTAQAAAASQEPAEKKQENKKTFLSWLFG